MCFQGDPFTAPPLVTVFPQDNSVVPTVPPPLFPFLPRGCRGSHPHTKLAARPEAPRGFHGQETYARLLLSPGVCWGDQCSLLRTHTVTQTQAPGGKPGSPHYENSGFSPPLCKMLAVHLHPHTERAQGTGPLVVRLRDTANGPSSSATCRAEWPLLGLSIASMRF